MTARPSANVLDVDEADFAAEVVERSHTVPVVVDFWAAWCGPCRTLGPMIEQAVEHRGGEVRLAKVDVDANQGLAGRFGVQGIPAVKGFRDGEVVAEFTGAVPRPQIEAFLDELVPSQADKLAARARVEVATDPDRGAAMFREALAAEPGHRGASLGLAELVVDDDPQRAMELMASHRPEPAVEAIAARAELAMTGGGDLQALLARVEQDPNDVQARLLLGRLLAASGDHEAGAEHLLAVVRAGGDTREPAREALVAIFTALGPTDELVARIRPRLASALH